MVAMNTNNHEDDTPCAFCNLQAHGFTEEESLSIIDEHSERCMREYGWYAHAVTDEEDIVTGYNIHTHGLPESFDHPDLQIVLPMDPRSAHAIFTTAIDRIKSGEKFQAGDKVAELITSDYKILFADAIECDRPVLRMIFPDVNGELPPTGKFSVQMDGTILLD